MSAAIPTPPPPVAGPPPEPFLPLAEGAPSAEQLEPTAGGSPAVPPSKPSSSHSRLAWIAAAGAITVAAIAVALLVVMSGSGTNQSAAYRQKLSSALAPMVAANSALSTSLQSLQGNNSTAARTAANQAQQTVVAARGALAVLTVPSGSAQLSQQVQQALTEENGYLQAVTTTLAGPSAENIAQLGPLATSTQSALVLLASVAPGASTSLTGTETLSTWASGRVAAAARASAAAARTAQQQAVQQAASKAATKAAQAAVANSTLTSPSSSSVPANPGFSVQDLPVQCGYGVAGSAGMTCTFANNAFYEYWNVSGGNPLAQEFISAWSPEAQTYYPLSCGSGDGVVDCTGTDGTGAPLDARFSAPALSAYTSSQAAAYAASGKPGPNG